MRSAVFQPRFFHCGSHSVMPLRTYCESISVRSISSRSCSAPQATSWLQSFRSCTGCCAAAFAFDARRPSWQRAADSRIARLHRTTFQALPALRRTCAHAPARPLAALRRVPAGRHALPHPLAGQRLRHDPLAAHGDAGLHADGWRAAHPRRAARRAPVAARRRAGLPPPGQRRLAGRAQRAAFLNCPAGDSPGSGKQAKVAGKELLETK